MLRHNTVLLSQEVGFDLTLEFQFGSKCWRQSWETVLRIKFENKVKVNLKIRVGRPFWKKNMLFPCIYDVWKGKAFRVNFQSASK